ncbi:MAG: hypothetical protein KF843_08890 [Flavobacteriales bacterium]|nr:hypothetical protein [Flavobacteriales bacterium]
MAMNDRCLWWIPLVIPVFVSAQVDSTELPFTGPDHRFTIEAIGSYDSNVIYNDLVMGIYRGGPLSGEVRKRTLDVLGSGNRAGSEQEGTATYTWGDSLFGRSGLRPRFSMGYRDFLGMRFTRDAFALSFFGNAAFEGRTAHIGPSNFEQINYQTFSFGVEDRRTGSFLELGVVNGRALNSGQLHTADLYTAMDGRYLELELDGNYHRSDTGSTGLSNGIGAVLSMQWRKPLQLFQSPGALSITVTDLGFIAWNPNSLSVTKDSTIRFEGLEVSGILDLDDLILNENTLQDSLGLGYSKGGYLRMLPARMEAKLEFGREYKGHSAFLRSAYAVSVDYRLLPGYVPYAIVDRNLELTKCIMVQVGAAYGGFGDLRARLGLQALLGKHVGIRLGTPNLIGLASGQARGKAVAANIEMVW